MSYRTFLAFVSSVYISVGSFVCGQDPTPVGGPPVVVVVTPTRSETTALDVPAAVITLNPTQLQQSRKLTDALDRSPGVMQQRTSAGQNSPYFRGLTGYHTLLVLDGIRLNNSILRSGPNEYWNLVDGNALDSVEAFLGPGSVLYGSDAVGGVLQGLPKRRRDFGVGNDFDQRLAMRASSAEKSVQGRAEISGVLDGDLGFVLGTSLNHFGDLDAGGSVGRQPLTGFDSQFGDIALDLRVDDLWTLSLLGRHSRLNDLERVHSTNRGVSFAGTSVGNDRRRRLDLETQLLALSLSGEDLSGWIESVRWTVSYQRLLEDSERIRSNGARELSGVRIDTFGVSMEARSTLLSQELVYGFDYYRDTVDSYRDRFDAMGTFTSSSIQGPVADGAHYDLAGVFVQSTFDVTAEIQAVLGARLTYAGFTADHIADPVLTEVRDADHWWSLVGSARLVWQVDEAARVYGGVARAFRAPNLSDISRLDTALSNELEIPSSGLEPETFVSFEAGVKYHSSSFRGEVAFAYTLLNDLIIRQPTGDVATGGEILVAKRNGGDGHILSLDFRGELSLDQNWMLHGTFSWVDGQAETFPTSAPIRTTEVLSKLSPVRGSVGLSYTTDDGAWRVGVFGNAALRQDRLNSQDRRDGQRIPPNGTPSWWTLNAELSYTPDVGQRYYLSLENILDRNYRFHGSGVQEPGINLVVGFDITF